MAGPRDGEGSGDLDGGSDPKAKARCVFNTLKDNKGEEFHENFSAIRDMFQLFRRRFGLNTVHVSGKLQALTLVLLRNSGMGWTE